MALSLYSRKSLKFVLIVCLLCTLLPGVLHAAANNPNTGYADKLKQLGLFAGTNNGYELDRAPTRLEGLVILIRLLGKEKEAQSLSGDPVPFTDVPKWGAGFVNYAYQNKLAQGIDGKRFGSGNAMTAVQYATFILRALGYQDSQGDFTYQEALNKAAGVGVIDTALRDQLGQTKFLRGHAVQISYQALKQALKGQSTTLAQKLINDGVITKASAIQAGLFDAGSSSGGDKTVVTFPDPGLEQLIRAAINKPTGVIYRSDVAQLTSLNSDQKHTRIRSLNGIEALQSLTHIELDDNLIKDLTPLKSLTKLQSLSLARNSIEDLSPLSALKQLESLNVGYNFIRTPDVLAQLPELSSLLINDNGITSIDSLAALKKLSFLNISYTAVSNINVINGMPALTTLNLDGTPIADLSPMKGKTLSGYDSAEEIQALGNKAREIIEVTIKPGMTDVEKEQAIHDYLIDLVTYDDSEFNRGIPTKTSPYSAYGALIEQYAVCDGYAHALQILGKLAGLDMFYISGRSSIEHAWNLIRLDGVYYHVDATWNDPEDLWGGALPDSPEAERLYEFHKRMNFNVTNENRQLAISWDSERYPSSNQQEPSAGNHSIQVSVNTEIPVARDLLVWVTLKLRYQDGDVQTGRNVRQPIVIPYGINQATATVNIPAEIPIEDGGVTYYLSYEAYETEYFFHLVQDLFYSQDRGITFTDKEKGILEPGAHLKFTVLKIGSKGMTYNQAAAQGLKDQAALDGSMFGYTETYVGNSIPPYNLYKAVNTQPVTLPPHSAIFVSELLIGTEFEMTSWKYLYGETPLAANHSDQPKVYQPGELAYTLRPTNERLKRTADVYFRLSVFDGSFDENDYQAEAAQHKVVFQDQWVKPKQ
ncbi:hypothetical protein J2T15_003452 [Paenibacillus harenae]|uniref:SLH domain-containing protein n=1 Tax=Paenibacillus harenae TaxID=306543 RepID=A0ABT9U6Z7_PAEHA|nr:hypothetical protein [Paenibacillus harenae]